MRTRQIALPIEVEHKIADDDNIRVLDEIIDTITDKIKYKGNYNHKTNHITMMEIIVYGFMEQITSLRNIEKACKRDINFKWLLQYKKPPSKSTIGWQ